MSIFQKLTFADPYDGAIFLPGTDVTPIFPAPPPDPEIDALGQWEFGPNSNSLKSISGVRVVTPFSPANLPVYNTNYLTPVSGGLYGLLTDVVDTGTWTRWAVVQYKSTGGVLFGTSTSDGAAGGGMLWVNPTSGFLTSTIRGFSSGIAKVPPGVVDGDWIFVALSMSPTGMIIYIGNSDVINVSGTYAIPTTNRFHTVGNCYHAGGNFYAALNHASHGVHMTAKSQSQIDAIYGRVKLRMAAVAINVK